MKSFFRSALQGVGAITCASLQHLLDRFWMVSVVEPYWKRYIIQGFKERKLTKGIPPSMGLAYAYVNSSCHVVTTSISQSSEVCLRMVICNFPSV